MLLRRVALPNFCEPCLPSPAAEPPAGAGWLHEIKHEGFRMLVRRDTAGVRLFTRYGHDWTGRFPLIASVLVSYRGRMQRKAFLGVGGIFFPRCFRSARTRYSVLVWLLSVGLLLVAYSAFALVGAIDTEDKYPFVVQISSEIGSCSGAVSRAGLVSTAAHCVWNNDVGLAKQLKIHFRDADGINRTVDARRIFIPQDFSSAFSKWKAEQGVVSNEETMRNFLNMTLRDIAFIVPQRWVETEGIPHWATELLQGSQEFFDDTIQKELGDTIEKELGDLANVRAMTVGYGNFECNDFNKREKNCRRDGYRRYAEIPLRAGVRIANRTWRVPSIWCTGVNVEKINPVQHGDSGGPLFVKALDGRWLFVGYNSVLHV